MQRQEWNRQIIAYRNGGPITVGDVGKTVVGPQDITLEGWVNRHRGIILLVEQLPGANVIATVQAVKAALPQIEASLPPTINISVLSDRTTSIRASVADVEFTLILTVALVVGVIFLFLRSVWPTIIPGVAVPVSIVGTFGAMYAFGYSLDNLSLMGLSIAVGFVVDDAIVMVENVARHIEMGKTPMQAALDGAGEIGFTIVSMSISLVAVFIPLLLMSGMVGRMFQEFAVAVAVTIAFSLVVSLTLTPAMAARLLRHERPRSRGGWRAGSNGASTGSSRLYDRALKVALRHRFATLMVMLATVAATAWLFIVIPKGFFPEQDTGLILGVSEAAGISPPGMAALQQRTHRSGVEGPGGRLDRGGDWRRGGDLDRESGTRVHRAEAKERAPADRCGDGAARPGDARDSGSQALLAGGAGYQYRRPADRDAVPIHADGRGFGRAEPMGAGGGAAAGEAAGAHRRDERPTVRGTAA